MPPAHSVFQSVDTLLGQMLAQLQANGSPITDFHDGSTARTFFEALAVAVSVGTSSADQLQLDGHLDTATGDALDALATNFEVARNPAVQASGQIQVTRQDTTDALLLAAGWSQLSTTPSIPGQAGVTVVTTEDGNFDAGQATAVINAQAVIGGLAGNLAAGTSLTPLAPILGISSQTGYEVSAAFTNGVDAESDDAFRYRIPITVRGRVKGKADSYLAAVLGVPGVIGAGVLQATDERGDGSTVPTGSVEIYYRGSPGLLPAVQSAADNASVLNQDDVAFPAASLPSILFLPANFPASGGLVLEQQLRGQERCVLALNIYINPGTNASAISAAVQAVLLNYFATLTIGQHAIYSEVINLLVGVAGVVDVNLPMLDFRLWTDPGGTTGNITCLSDSYLNLDVTDLTINVLTLT